MVSAGIEPEPLELQVQSWTIMTKINFLVTHYNIMVSTLMAASMAYGPHGVLNIVHIANPTLRHKQICQTLGLKPVQTTQRMASAPESTDAELEKRRMMVSDEQYALLSVELQRVIESTGCRNHEARMRLFNLDAEDAEELVDQGLTIFLRKELERFLGMSRGALCPVLRPPSRMGDCAHEWGTALTDPHIPWGRSIEMVPEDIMHDFLAGQLSAEMHIAFRCFSRNKKHRFSRVALNKAISEWPWHETPEV